MDIEGLAKLLDVCTAALESSNRKKIPQGYEIHEIPSDYFGPVFLEGQMRAAIEAEREACARICDELYSTENAARLAAALIALTIRARGEQA